MEGPPYTTGAIHIGHAWGRALRDSILRYKRMKGFDVRVQPGFDMHGLPIEVKVEKKLGITNKQEIVSKIGLKNFTEECRKFALENLWPMVEDFKRLGVWKDWHDPYMTIKNEYIEGAWWALAKAYDNGFLYLGKKAMTWCPRCGSALAKHELEYSNLKDPSIFVKLKIENKDEFLIVWTTTPWTIPFNMGVMVNPDIDYVKVKAGKDVWILAEAAIERLKSISGKELEVIETFKGRQLEGLKYEHPFSKEVEFHKSVKNAHRVVLSSEYVSTEEGSGMVHCAPGCGAEDFEVGKANGLEPFNETDEHGKYKETMGSLTGLVAKKDDKKLVQLMKDKGIVIAERDISHEYPGCWRCKTPVIFRATDQWFLATSQLREKMREHNKKIVWIPDWAGNRHFDSWLSSLQDWCISRQRFWGIPLPIWLCDCGEKKVIGTRKELKELSGKELDDLHRPYIDEVKLSCKCGKQMHRTPDILDVWLDSGVSPWASLDYPSNDKLFGELGFPDLILEGSDQIRGWFNSLTCMGMISFGKIPFRSCYMHGMINDTSGRKMSKSLGNTISPYEIIDNYGADTLRYYVIGGSKPGLDLNFNHEDAKIKSRNLTVLWNLHNYLIELSKELEINPKMFDAAYCKKISKSFSVEERFMHAKLQQVIQTAGKLYDECRLNEVPWVLESLFLTLSRTYIQMVREKAAIGSKEERKVVLFTIWTVLTKALAMFATIAPFISEVIWQNLKKEFELAEESIHLIDWPEVNEELVNDHLVMQMESAESIIQSILAAREKAKLSVRWPVKEVFVVSHDNHVLESADVLNDVIKKQTNVKSLNASSELTEVKTSLKANAGALGKSFGAKSPHIIAKLSQLSANDALAQLSKEGKFTINVNGEEISLTKDHIDVVRESPKHLVFAEFKGGVVYLNAKRSQELDAEGFAREITRRLQQLRKEAGLQKTDIITAHIQVSDNLEKILKSWKSKIKDICGAKDLKISKNEPSKDLAHSAEETIKEEKIVVSLEKVD